MMRAVTVPGLRPKTPADLERARKNIEWVDDDDLVELESKSRPGAALLGFFTWGGGRIYLGDLPRGLGLVGLLIAWTAVSPLLPAFLGPLLYTLVGAGSAMWSYQGARAVNRFVATRTDLQLRAGPDPSAYRLLAAAATVNPHLALPAEVTARAAPPVSGPHAELIDRLRKLAALRRSGVLHETELRDRKIDLLSAAAPPTRAELDDLLFALLPLGDEGVLDADDFEFLKQLGGSR
jgi:hypothetical protein